MSPTLIREIISIALFAVRLLLKHWSKRDGKTPDEIQSLVRKARRDVRKAILASTKDIDSILNASLPVSRNPLGMRILSGTITDDDKP